MTLGRLQQEISAALNADERLLQGGCMAFAEDAQAVAQAVAAHLQQACGPAPLLAAQSFSRFLPLTCP